MTVLGITGGTGGGKTTLLARVEAMGGAVIDCDAVYHGLLETNAALRRDLEERFPEAVAHGALNRKNLGKLVFENASALADLNRIAHRYVLGAVLARLESARRAGCALAAVDAIALVESGLSHHCDVSVAVLAPKQARVRRLMAREGITEEYACLRIAAQKSDEQFAAQCDMVLNNDGESAAAFSVKCDQLLLKLTGGPEHG